MDAMPQMDNQFDGNNIGGNMSPIQDQDGGMLPMDDQSMSVDSDFDTNFDAGVDADENTDPKKYIQQLTGKLSQSLRKYNQELPNADSELCKYVAGMILKQTTEGLTDGDKKDIMDKVNGNGSDDSNEGDMENGNDIPQMDDQNMENEQPIMENVNHRSLVNEIFQELINQNDNSNYKIAKRPLKNIGFKKKPFTSPTLY